MKKLLEAKERDKRSTDGLRVMTREENHKQQQEMDRQIKRAERLMHQTINNEMRTVFDLVKDQPIAGSLLHQLMHDSNESRVGIASQGRFMDKMWIQPINPLAGPTVVPLIA